MLHCRTPIFLDICLLNQTLVQMFSLTQLIVSHNVHSNIELSSYKHERVTYLHDDLEVPEQLGNRSLRVGRNVYSTKAQNLQL